LDSKSSVARIAEDLGINAWTLRDAESEAPMYQAVYHGYTLVFGGDYGKSGPTVQGKWWLMGNQNG